VSKAALVVEYLTKNVKVFISAAFSLGFFAGAVVAGLGVALAWMFSP